jgi:hypothetical protein
MTTTLLITTCLAYDPGPDLERLARRLAVLIAFTYAAGQWLGSWLHQANAHLAAMASAPHQASERLTTIRQRRTAPPSVALTPSDGSSDTPVSTDAAAPKATPVAKPAPKRSRKRNAQTSSR